MNVHIIQQDPWVGPGEYAAWAARNGHSVTYTRCWLFEPVPKTTDADLLVVLGGYQNPAMTREECPYFDSEAEQALIRKYAESGRAVVGSCLGAQLIGQVFSGTYAHSPQREVGPISLRLTAEGRADPFLKAFPEVFESAQWHNDMPALSPDCTLLAFSEGCPHQIVRYGKYIYAFQAHMEFTRGIVEAGIEDSGGVISGSGPFVHTPEEFLAFDFEKMNALLSSFLDALVQEYQQEHF